MAGNLRGNLGLKSGPLAPTSAKLTTQYLVLDHMNNHYSKIAKAKPAIDTRPPKSIATSQKMRDRKNRSRMLSSPRTRPVTAMSHDEVRQYEELLNDEPEDEEERLVHSIMKSTLMEKQRGSASATRGSTSQGESLDPSTYISQPGQATGGVSQFTTPYSNGVPRPLSARSVRSAHSVSSFTSRVPITSHDPAKITYNGDILEKRAHKFTEPGRPFTPRTNISNHESRLKSSKCYNPPRPASAGKMRPDETTHQRPTAAPRARKARPGDPTSHNGTYHDLGDTAVTSQLSESMLMDMTLMSRDGRHSQASDHQVPRLDISMDTDHVNWLQEQAGKAKVRARSGAHLRSSLPTDDENTVSEGPSALYLSSGQEKSTRMETLKKEEEQKYLAFAKEVTDDVLARSISTDRVLNRVFENHIERRKQDLDETKMRRVIQDLRKDLGLRESSLERGSRPTIVEDNNYNNRGLSSNGSNLVNGTSSSSNIQKSSSEKSSVREDSLSFSNTNGQTSTSLEPLNNATSNSDMSTTLDSTSTMKFGRTADVFSTINSEATLEEQEARDNGLSGEDDLSATQALRQYQFNLTVKEASAEVNESARESGNGRESDISDRSNKLERPPTGERRKDEEDTKSDTSSLKATVSSSAENTVKAKRRDRFRKSKEPVVDNEPHVDSQPSLSGNSQLVSDDIYSSEHSTQGVRTPGTQEDHHSSSDVIDDGEVSVKSSGSQRPAVKPRSRRRVGQVVEEEKPVSEPPHAQDSSELHSGTHNGQQEGRGVSSSARSGQQDHSGSSVPGESGIGSSRTTGHDDTLEDASKVDYHEATISEDKGDNYEDDYEDDYEGDEDDGQGLSTHRTSDDDF